MNSKFDPCLIYKPSVMKSKKSGSGFTDCTEFKSAPWCVNGHMHTILCSLLFTSAKTNSHRIEIETPDKDFLHIDLYEQSKFSQVAVLFHGLEGSSTRYYITRLASHLYQRGFTVIAMNFRSCSGVMNRNRKFYHSGETHDLNTLFKWIDSHFPGRVIHAAGFSLGASALLNYLREHRTHHNIQSAVAVSTPFELKKGSLNLEIGFNKVYTNRFLKTLREKIELKRKAFSDLPEFNGSTLYEFDDQITGPIHGFEGADHYYERCSSAFFMDNIKTKTLIIHSIEDPLCPFKWVPVKEIRDNPNIKTCYTSRGGHVGFWSMPHGWLNNTISDYFLQN